MPTIAERIIRHDAHGHIFVKVRLILESQKCQTDAKAIAQAFENVAKAMNNATAHKRDDFCRGIGNVFGADRLRSFGNQKCIEKRCKNGVDGE